MVLLISLTVAAATPTLADTYPFGSVVDKKDADYTPVPKAFDFTTLCMFDLDGRGTYSVGEPLFLHFTAATCAGMLSHDDLRLLPHGEYDQGSLFESGDADDGRLLSGPVPHAIRYIELDPDGKFKKKDAAYVDLFFLGAMKVDPGDVRLNGFGDYPPGSIVQAGDADVNIQLTEVKGTATTFGDANVVYEAGKGIYVNMDKGALGTKDMVVEDNDIRLNLETPKPSVGEASAPATPPGEALIQVTALRAPADPVQVLAGVRLEIDVTNTGTAAGAGLVETALNGLIMDARGTPTLAPGESTTLVLLLPAPARPGTVMLTAGDANATAEIVAAPAGTDTLESRMSALERRTDALHHGALAMQSVTSKLDDRVSALEPIHDTDEGEHLQTASVGATTSNDAPAVSALVLVGLIAGLAAIVGRRR